MIEKKYKKIMCWEAKAYVHLFVAKCKKNMMKRNK